MSTKLVRHFFLEEALHTPVVTAPSIQAERPNTTEVCAVIIGRSLVGRRHGRKKMFPVLHDQILELQHNGNFYG
jgi:hypothetical protein|eukprot:SAG31_NODE_19436_length_602_cov_0.819085_2_plen_74_part_00